MVILKWLVYNSRKGGIKLTKNYEKLKEYLDRYQALNAALTLFAFDSDTYAPTEAFDLTTKVTSILSKEAFDIITSQEVKALTEACGKEELPEVEAKIVAEVSKQLEKMSRIPGDEFQASQILEKKSQAAWLEAKKKGDFSIFAPYLKDMIETQKRFASYRQKPGQSLYEVLLDDFEPGMTEAAYDHFFEQVKKEIVPLIHQISALNKEKPGFLSQHFDLDKQREFNTMLAKYIGFDPKRGKISETEHPYTTSLHNHDVRFTNHYYENQLDSAIFSTIHEGGHAIYEQQIDDALTLTVLGGGTSSGMHESQSRFMENCIGRSKAFWQPLYPKLVETFPEQLKDISLETFVAGINDARCSLIRTEADELTYPLHIVIRYELEKKMFENDIDVNELPAMWDDLYESYLGVRPDNVSQGILQDLHWSGGMFGYFPTYALGSAIACQIYHYLCAHYPVEKWLLDGELDHLKAWLKEHIHRFGGLKNTDEILTDAVGESFNPKYYIDYLVGKYSALYDLE